MATLEHSYALNSAVALSFCEREYVFEAKLADCG